MFVKTAYKRLRLADDTKPVYAMVGRLERSASGWGLLVVPNAIANGVFKSLALPGIEQPKGPNGKFNAHVSVFRGNELADLERRGKLTEFGKSFKFQIGGLTEVKPIGWDDVEKCWFLRIHSPELEKLRKSYGLTGLPNKDGKLLPFHLTVAIRRKGVLNQNEFSKAASVNWLLRQDSPVHQFEF